MTTYKVLAENLDDLKLKVEKLNKRARKLSVQEIVLQIGPQERDKIVDESTGEVEWYLYYPVEVIGSSPVINGWKFVATLDHTDEGTLVRAIPDSTIDFSPYYAAPPYCDHCRLIRKRNDTYLVQHVETGLLKQVGSNCLADFLGHASPQSYAAQAEMLIVANEACASGERSVGHREHFYDLETYLVWIAATMRQHGWVSRGKAREQECAATADIAMWEWEAKQKGLMNRDVYPTEVDKQTARLALEWAQNLDDPIDSYLHNVWVVAKGFAFTYRQQGLAGSIVAAYSRATRQRVEAAKSQHVGQVGKPFQTKVTITHLSYAPGFRGQSKTVISMVDEHGNALVWFATNDPDVKVGDSCMLSATIKKHGDYRGAAQTVVSYAKLTTLAREAGAA